MVGIQELSFDEAGVVTGGQLTTAQMWEVAVAVGVIILAIATSD